LTVFEIFTNLADNDPVFPLPDEQFAEAFFAEAIRRGCVQIVDAEVPRQLEYILENVQIWQGKTLRIFDGLIAPKFDGAESNF
jgi:hypothetical protein